MIHTYASYILLICGPPYYQMEVGEVSVNQPRMRVQEARCGVRLNYVIFPIDFRELRRVLAKYGYELPHIDRLPPPPTRIAFGGNIARKGETIIVAESEIGEIGVVSRSLQEAKKSFEELANIINSELGISLYENVRFYWYIVHYKVDTGKIPRSQLAKIENDRYINRFSEILGKDLSMFSIRLSPKDATPNSENWFDIAIEPDLMDERLYHVGIVFRNPSKSETETFVSNLEDNIIKLLQAIEEE